MSVLEDRQNSNDPGNALVSPNKVSSHVLKEDEGKLLPCSLYSISLNGLIKLVFTPDLHRDARWKEFHWDPGQFIEGFMEPKALETAETYMHPHCKLCTLHLFHKCRNYSRFPYKHPPYRCHSLLSVPHSNAVTHCEGKKNSEKCVLFLS